MKIKTIKKIVVLFTVNHVLSITKYFELKRKMLNSIGYQIGEGTKVVGPVYNTGTLIIGKNCWIGKNITVNGNGTVIIGDNCDIAPEVTFLTGGHKIGDSTRRAGKGEIYTIKVGNGCWLGARSTIGRNVTIGDGCMVAACACVMKDITENRLVGGVPAKEIRVLDD